MAREKSTRTRKQTSHGHSKSVRRLSSDGVERLRNPLTDHDRLLDTADSDSKLAKLVYPSDTSAHGLLRMEFEQFLSTLRPAPRKPTTKVVSAYMQGETLKLLFEARMRLITEGRYHQDDSLSGLLKAIVREADRNARSNERGNNVEPTTST